MEKRNIIVVDIDGTIAKIDHRLPKLKDHDWLAFYNAANHDEPIIENILTIKKDLEETKALPIFVTGRSDVIRDITIEWLFKHFFEDEVPKFFRYLHMRHDGDHREDFEVKKEIHDMNLIFDNVLRVYEDRPQVIRMWKELGYDVVDVGPGFEF